jgi:hypothetical protein
MMEFAIFSRGPYALFWFPDVVCINLLGLYVHHMPNTTCNEMDKDTLVKDVRAAMTWHSNAC